MQMQIMYVDALRAYYQEGKPVITNDQFNELKMELNWQGSEFPSLSRTKIEFVEVVQCMGAYCALCVRCARAVHKVCTGPYPSCIVVPSTSNNEPCYAFI